MSDHVPMCGLYQHPVLDTLSRYWSILAKCMDMDRNTYFSEQGIVVDGSLHQRITISSYFDELHRQTEGENGNMTLVWERWEYDTSVGKM